MIFENIEKYKNKSIIIRWHPKWTHTHSWIHYRFFRAFEWLGFEVQWLENKIENLPDKNKEYIIITENSQDKIILENASKKRILFNHYLWEKNYKNYKDNFSKLIPFTVTKYNLAKYTDKKIWSYFTEWDSPIMSIEEYHYQINYPSILWWSDLLPHEMKREPYNYNNSNKDINFIWSWWHNNALQLESLRFYCIKNWLKYNQYGKHIILRSKIFWSWFLSPNELIKKTKEAYISPAIQWSQIDDGYIPCRLFINASLSTLLVSNNPYAYNIFNDDEIIIDRDIWKMMDKARQIIEDKKVDEYTKKAFDKVKERHTYINRIDELFSYL